MNGNNGHHPSQARRASPHSLVSGFAVLVATLLLPCSAGAATAPEWRAFWVDTWNPGCRQQSEVEALLGKVGDANAKGDIRNANCNAVFVEVRRRADTAYPSGVGEPFMSDLTPPDFNALQAIIDAAHDTTGGKKRIDVHCWLVTFATAGNGATGAVYFAHHSTPTGSLTSFDNYWPTRDNNGAETADKALDPGHPLLLQHTVKVCMDLVNNFDIDGIHYDYIRFTANNQGYNPTSIARYNARYLTNSQPHYTNSLFMQWRRDQVTAVVRQVYARIQKAKPWVKQSGSFVTWNPSPTNSTRTAFTGTRPYYDVYSDWDSWMQEGIVDMAVPMTYYDWASLPADYTKWMNFEKDRKFNRHMIIGPGTYHNNLDYAIYELQMTRDASPAGNHAHGFSGYSYASPYYLTWTPKQVYGTWSNFVTRLVPDVTPTWADIPDMWWKSSPTNGHIMGTVAMGGTGAWADLTTVSITGPTNRSMMVDGTGFYAFIDLPPGTYNVTASKAGYADLHATVNVTVGAVTGNMYQKSFIFGTPPQLSIAPAAPNGVAISWPATAPGWVLQANSTLAANTWNDLTNAPVQVGGSLKVTVSPAPGTKYYRLRLY